MANVFMGILEFLAGFILLPFLFDWVIAFIFTLIGINSAMIVLILKAIIDIVITIFFFKWRKALGIGYGLYFVTNLIGLYIIIKGYAPYI